MSKDRLQPQSHFMDRVKAAADSVALPQAGEVLPQLPKEPPDFWSIVVVGTIDPRQHHPFWYHLIGCINEEESQRANSNLTFFGTPPTGGAAIQQPAICMFDAGDFGITVTPDRWMVATLSEKNCNRMLDVAAIVFTKLNEISVTAFGINQTLSVFTKAISGKEFLSQKLASADLALLPGKVSSQISYTIHHENSDTGIQLMPSDFDDRRLNVAYNRNHPIPITSGYCDVGKLIREHAEDDWRSASQYGKELAECIVRAEKK